MSSVSSIADLFQEAGWPAWATLALSILACGAVLLALTLRRNVSTIVSWCFALLPQLSGWGGYLWGMNNMRTALEYTSIDPNVKARLFAQGSYEASCNVAIASVAGFVLLTLCILATALTVRSNARGSQLTSQK